ncbi:MAG TPA: ribokinase [Nocardioidaceae bacterium]|nr:ribokinase [Nocardioidaceae bacterium]
MTRPAEGGGLLVLGSLNLDVMLGVRALPTVGETVLGADAVLRPGGKGANQAVAAALTGTTVAMAGRVGDDERAATLRAALAGAGVDTSQVRTTAERSTGLAVVLVNSEGDNAIVVSPGANHAMGPADVDELRGVIETAAVLLLQLELPVPVVTRAVEVAGEVGTRVVVNLAPATTVPPAMLQGLEVLVVNRSEAEHLVGHVAADLDALRRAADELRALGPTAVVVTAGADGAVVADDRGTRHVPVAPVPVVDTTGAGDAFVGVLAAQLSRGRTLDEALAAATSAASQAVQVPGAQLSTLGRLPGPTEAPVPEPARPAAGQAP